jgi:predicted nucleotidyltransferase
MSTLGGTSLREAERRVLERFVRQAAEELGPELRSIWLYGSRARGEIPGAESDVDVLVVATGERFALLQRLGRLMDRAAAAEGADPFGFSVQVYSPELLAQRREIRSFFVQEVDRDRVVLWGER